MLYFTVLYCLYHIPIGWRDQVEAGEVLHYWLVHWMGESMNGLAGNVDWSESSAFLLVVNNVDRWYVTLLTISTLPRTVLRFPASLRLQSQQVDVRGIHLRRLSGQWESLRHARGLFRGVSDRQTVVNRRRFRPRSNAASTGADAATHGSQTRLHDARRCRHLSCLHSQFQVVYSIVVIYLWNDTCELLRGCVRR